MRDILAIDVGTTRFKAGVFAPDLTPRSYTSRSYDANFYDRVKADIDPKKWWEALRSSCSELRGFLPNVGVLALSVTTPGLVPMNEDGDALGPAILFLDGRSHEQARQIRARVGEDYFLETACNLPVSGGSSLCSILWIQQNQPDVWRATAKFGHCNTYLVKRLTGSWAIDPSTISITGLYNTSRNDLTWNARVLDCAGIPDSKLPPVLESHRRVGGILPEVAAELGLPADTAVLCGANDAVLAALSGGVADSGDIGTTHGTCDISYVCTDHPTRSRNYNIRCHVLPGRWLTFCVLNTGGKALEWFHSVFCADMTADEFFTGYIPSILTSFLDSGERDQTEEALPHYVPFLQGSRYCLEQRTAGFSGVTGGVNAAGCSGFVAKRMSGLRGSKVPRLPVADFTCSGLKTIHESFPGSSMAFL